MDAHVLHLADAIKAAHVHSVLLVALLFSQPSPGLAGCQLAQEGCFELLGLALGPRCGVVTKKESDGHKHQTQLEQRGQRHPGLQPPRAQNGEFGALGQPRHDKDAANEHRDGQQLVHVVWRFERNEQQGVLQLVTLRSMARQGLQLVDQVKKQKQGQKSQGHKDHCADDFAIKQLAHGFHAVASCGVRTDGIRCRQLQFMWRRPSHTRATASTPPCSSSM